MNSLIFSDIHIHAHKKSQERLNHCLQTLDWVFTVAKDNNVKYLFFLGDLFHDRQKIDVLAYHDAYVLMEKYLSDNKLSLYLLVGNHDMWHDDNCEVNSIRPLQSLPGVSVIDKPSSVVIDGVDISFLPYTHNPLDDIKGLSPKRDVLMAHLALNGAELNSYGSVSEVSVEHDGDMCKVDTDCFTSWNEVFLGHYHMSQRFSHGKTKIEYVGSPLQLSFSEAFQEKHVILYDLKTRKKEYIKNNFSPKHFILKPEQIDESLKSHFVRVVVDDISSSDVLDIKNKVAGIGAGSVEIKQQDKKLNENEIIEGLDLAKYSGLDILKKFIEAKNPDGLDKERLLKMGEFIINNHEEINSKK